MASTRERRKAKRVIITAVAEVSDLKTLSVQEGYVSNISSTGVGVFLKNSMTPGSRVEIKLSFYTTEGINDAKQIQGIVKRVEMLSNVYSTGIEFDRLDPKKDSELLSYLSVQQVL